MARTMLEPFVFYRLQYVLLLPMLWYGFSVHQQQEMNVSRLLNILYKTKLITITNLDYTHKFSHDVRTIPMKLFSAIQLIESSERGKLKIAKQDHLKSAYEKNMIGFRMSNFKDNPMKIKCMDIAIDESGIKGKLLTFKNDFATEPIFYYRWRHTGDQTEYVYRYFDANGRVLVDKLQLNRDGSGAFRKRSGKMNAQKIEWDKQGKVLEKKD